MAQCTAHGKKSGQRCKSQAISGATVCRLHGGSAPQVKRKALERLLSLVDPALGTLARGVAKRKGIPTAQEIAAAKDILDRAAIKHADAAGGPDDTVQLTWDRFAALYESRNKGGASEAE